MVTGGFAATHCEVQLHLVILNQKLDVLSVCKPTSQWLVRMMVQISLQNPRPESVDISVSSISTPNPLGDSKAGKPTSGQGHDQVSIHPVHEDQD